jgi:hypothetical protein
MADPVSWFVIEPGWRVDDASGNEVGRVLEVAGDSNADIFDGVVIAFSAFDKPRYVPSEQVGEIVEGRVRVQLERAEIERLREYREPPVEEAIEPGEPRLTQRVETAVAPAPTRPTSIPLLRRVLLWFGLAGKR